MIHRVLAEAVPEVDGLCEALRRVRPDVRVHRVATAELGGLVGAGAAYEMVCTGADDLALVARLRARDPDLPLVAVARRADVGTADRLVAAGASDLFVLGDRVDERARTLCGKLAPIVRLRAVHRLQTGQGGPWALLGSTPRMVALRAAIHEAAAVPRPVLVVGERGTGKELVAHAIHEASRPAKPLVVVNCAAFPDALLESELFGHERGAYTGADRRATGRFEEAADGTVFLDEIGAMSLPFQQKILRVVEYGTYRRVGGGEELVSRARVIAATNVDLKGRIATGQFLPDLHDRLSFSVIEVPPLRARRDDLPSLAAHFLRRLGEEVPGIADRQLSAEALAVLARHPFPGNVRELKHLVERAATRATDGTIRAEHLGIAEPGPAPFGLDAQVEAFRRELVAQALAAAGGNQAAAARALSISYDQVRHWVKRYGLRPEEHAPWTSKRSPRR